MNRRLLSIAGYIGLALGIASAPGCAAQRSYRHPSVSVTEQRLDIDENRLAALIAGSISVYNDGSYSIESVERTIEKELERQTGRNLAVIPSFLENILEEGLILRKDHALDVSASGEFYSDHEIRQVIEDLHLPFIETKADHHDLTPYFVIAAEGKRAIAEELRRRYPQRVEEITRKVDAEFSKAKEVKLQELKKQIRSNKKLYVFIQGSINPFTANYEHYREELRKDNQELSSFFARKGYSEFVVKENKAYLNRLFRLISEEGSEETQLTVFYAGHGTADGLALGFNETVTSFELESSLKKFLGDATLFLASCYSGNIKDNFKDRRSKMRVISASNNGQPVQTNDPGNSGHLVFDVIRSNLDFRNFEATFRSIPERDYYPALYEPARK